MNITTVSFPKRVAALFAVAAVAWSASMSMATAGGTGSARGGAAQLMGGKAVTGSNQTSPDPAGPPARMSCPKCQNLMVKRVTVAKGRIPQTIWVQNHQCPGCASQFVVSGHGKAKTAGFVHTCTECGGSPAVCCAATPTQRTSPGAGGN